MKRVSFLRHAKSSWDDNSIDDYDRDLNARGLKDAPMMAERLKAKGYLPDLIFASSAKRALRTAELMREKLDFEGDFQKTQELYLAPAGHIISLIQALDDTYSNVLIVAHNPGIGNVSSYLSGRNLGNFPTAAIAQIEFKIDHWQSINAENGRLLFYDYPKNS